MNIAVLHSNLLISLHFTSSIASSNTTLPDESVTKLIEMFTFSTAQEAI